MKRLLPPFRGVEQKIYLLSSLATVICVGLITQIRNESEIIFLFFSIIVLGCLSLLTRPSSWSTMQEFEHCRNCGSVWVDENHTPLEDLVNVLPQWSAFTHEVARSIKTTSCRRCGYESQGSSFCDSGIK